MSKANALEEQMLELVNDERANAGLNPLRFNDTLNDSSEDHSSWMLDADVFEHQGVNGSTPHARMEDAGYQFEGNWHSGENIAWMSEDNVPGHEDEVVALHNGLMNSPGHRANILNPDFTEIGIGIEAGLFSVQNDEYSSVMISQNFAHTDADAVTPEVPPTAPEDDVVAGDPTTEPEDDVVDDVVAEDTPTEPEGEVVEDVVTEDPPAEPEDDVVEDVVTEVPPTEPEDEVVDDVVAEDPPTAPEDEVVEEVAFATEILEMFSNLFGELEGADSFVFASVGTVSIIEDQGALIHAETFFFIPEEFGEVQQIDAQNDIDVAQINDQATGEQIAHLANFESDWGMCG